MKSAEMSVYYARMEQLRVFDAVDELNSYIKAVRYYFADHLNETDKLVLDYMAQNAVKYLGVFGQKVATAAAALDKGAATIRRSIAKLERLGIIKRIPYLRPKSGGNGANIITFVKDAVKGVLPGKDTQPGANRSAGKVSERPSECPTDRPSEHPQVSTRQGAASPDAARIEGANPEPKTLNSFNTPSKTPLNTLVKERITYTREQISYTEEQEQKQEGNSQEVLGSDYAHYAIPDAFRRNVVVLGNDPKTINTAWSKVRLAFKNSQLEEYGMFFENLVEDKGAMYEIIRRTKSVVGGAKTGTVRDFGAVLYTTMLEYFQGIVQEIVAEQRRKAMQEIAAGHSLFYMGVHTGRGEESQAEPVAEYPITDNSYEESVYQSEGYVQPDNYEENSQETDPEDHEARKAAFWAKLKAAKAALANSTWRSNGP